MRLIFCTAAKLRGNANEFHAGLEQAFGKYLVIDGEYIWKYTTRAFDFSVLANTPIFYPIEWASSKIPGYAIRASVLNFHGVTAFVVMSSVAARFLGPSQRLSGTRGAAPGSGGGVFRIDHDENFNETTHVQYQPWKKLPWVAMNWRYDSGLVAGAVPCAGEPQPIARMGPNGSDTVVDVSGPDAGPTIPSGRTLLAGKHIGDPYNDPISSTLGANLCPAGNYGSKFLKYPASAGHRE